MEFTVQITFKSGFSSVILPHYYHIAIQGIVAKVNLGHCHTGRDYGAVRQGFAAKVDGQYGNGRDGRRVIQTLFGW